jgi:hypothetical protein
VDLISSRSERGQWDRKGDGEGRIGRRRVEGQGDFRGQKANFLFFFFGLAGARGGFVIFLGRFFFVSALLGLHTFCLLKRERVYLETGIQ